MDLETHPLQTAKTRDGRDICYQDMGNPHHPCILLIMGLNGTLADWDDEFCAILIESGFRVVRFDNRDAGRSSYFDHSGLPRCLVARVINRLMCCCFFPRCCGSKRVPCGLPIPYDLCDMAEDSVDLLDHLKVDRAHIVGGSMGGMIAQCLAISHIERVSSLCLLMTSGTFPLPDRRIMGAIRTPPPPGADTEGIISHMVEKKKICSGGRDLDDADEAYFKSSARASLCHHITDDADDDLVPCYHQRQRGALRQTTAIVQTPSRFRALRIAFGADEGATVPVTIVHGTNDPIIPIRHAVRLHQSIPHSTFHRVRGMGHEVPPPFHKQVCSIILSNVNKSSSGAQQNLNADNDVEASLLST